MKNESNTRYQVEDTFDGRYVNVVNLKTVGECDVVLGELQYAIDSIKADVEEGFGDAGWERSALRAKGDYEHKYRMTTLRRADLASKVEAVTPDHRHAVKFRAVAKAVLPPEDYKRINAQVAAQ